MKHSFRVLVFTCALFGVSAFRSTVWANPPATDELYTHCVSNWNEDGLGELFFKIALDDGCPLEGTPSAEYWQQKGRTFFPVLVAEGKGERVSAPLLCTIYLNSKLRGFTGNKPLCP